jgi:FkbM family methyltransferase
MPQSMRGIAKTVLFRVLPTRTALRVKRALSSRSVGASDEIEEDILHLIVPGDRWAIDAGAASGRYTEKLAFLSKGVFAFEPIPQLVEVIKARMLSNVTVRQAAVSDKTGHQTLHIPVDKDEQVTAMSSLSPRERLDADFTEIRVETATLDELAGKDVGFVKMDIEGHEIAALRGSELLIAEQRPLFLVEIDESDIAAVTGFFETRGYCGYFIFDRKVYPISELREDMLDFEEVTRTPLRKDAKYVNNFLFWPDEVSAREQTARIDAFFAATS